MAWKEILVTLKEGESVFVETFKSIVYSELFFNILFSFFGGLIFYFGLNSFLVWLDELLFGKSKVEITQNRIKKANPETVNSELGNFTVLYSKNSIGRFVIFKDVFYESDPTKVKMKFNTEMLNSVIQDQDYYSFIVFNNSSGIRKLKTPEILLESGKRIFFDKSGQNNIKEVNCGGYDSHSFCNVKLNDLKQGQEATFNMKGFDVKVPQYIDNTRVKPELKIKTFESHIKPLLEDENMIKVGGLEILLPKDSSDESSMYLLINNPVEWVPLNLSADKSSKAIECKIFETDEEKDKGTWFDLVIANHMMIDCKEIKIAVDFGKDKVKEVYFRSDNLPKENLVRVKPNEPTFIMVLDNAKAQTSQVIKILSEGRDFKSLKITSSVLKEDIIIKNLEKIE